MYYLIRSKLRFLLKSRIFQCGFVISLCLLFLISLYDSLLLPQKSESLPVKSAGQRHITKVLFKRRAPFPSGVFRIDNDIINGKLSDSPVKILCYILLSRSRVKAALIIKETWGSHCDELLFFGGYEFPQLPVVTLNVTEGYENLWGKTKAAIRYLSENPRFKNYQYFLKADDDTFVIVENLRSFIMGSMQLTINKPVWFGFKLKHKRMEPGYMSGGAGYVFNYEALVQVNNLLKQKAADGFYHQNILSGIGDCNVDGEYGIEDLELGKCFLSAGVENINTTDVDGGERFLPLPYDVFLNGAISSFHWIWSQAWNRVRTGERCCSQHLISMHEVSPSQMKMIYYLLYKIKVHNK